MAEKNDNIVCSICLGDFSDPRLIDCHHCFCLRCLDRYVDKFAVNNHFPCPLCRRDIAVPAGGVKDFATNFYLKIPNKIPGDHSDSKPKDFCSNHHVKEADVYCKDCSVAVCLRCHSKNHNGHQFVDLADDQTLQEYRKELKTIKQDFRNQISKFKTFSVRLEVKVSEVSETAAKLCSQVDDQIQKIYDELKSLGEKTKIRVNDWRDEETYKLNSVNKEIQIECENVGEIVDNSDDVLENKSFVRLIEILPDIRKKQRKQNQRKLDIPIVKPVKFLEGKINSDILSQQVGMLDRPSLEVGILDKPSLEVGQTFCFTTNFNVSQVKRDVTWQAADGDDVIPWTVGVWRLFEGRLGEWLRVDVKLDNITDKTIQYVDVKLDNITDKTIQHVDVKLDNITDKTIQRVDVKLRHKVINNNNDSQSVSVEYKDKISPGGRLVVGWCRLINYKTFNNKRKGFLDSNNNFRIQTTITITGVSR